MNLIYDKYQNSTPNKNISNDLINKIKEKINNKPLNLYDKASRVELYEELEELFKINQLDLFNINISDCLKKYFDWNENISNIILH